MGVINQINLLKVGQSSPSVAESDKPSRLHRFMLSLRWPSKLAMGGEGLCR